MQNLRYGAAVILLGVMGDNIIDFVNAGTGKIVQQNFRPGRVNRIEQSGPVAALYKIGIVTRTVRQGNKSVEQPYVKINRADG